MKILIGLVVGAIAGLLLAFVLIEGTWTAPLMIAGAVVGAYLSANTKSKPNS